MISSCLTLFWDHCDCCFGIILILTVLLGSFFLLLFGDHFTPHCCLGIIFYPHGGGGSLFSSLLIWDHFTPHCFGVILLLTVWESFYYSLLFGGHFTPHYLGIILLLIFVFGLFYSIPHCCLEIILLPTVLGLFYPLLLFGDQFTSLFLGTILLLTVGLGSFYSSVLVYVCVFFKGGGVILLLTVVLGSFYSSQLFGDHFTPLFWCMCVFLRRRGHFTPHC